MRYFMLGEFRDLKRGDWFLDGLGNVPHQWDFDSAAPLVGNLGTKRHTLIPADKMIATLRVLDKGQAIRTEDLVSVLRFLPPDPFESDEYKRLVSEVGKAQDKLNAFIAAAKG